MPLPTVGASLLRGPPSLLVPLGRWFYPKLGSQVLLWGQKHVLKNLALLSFLRGRPRGGSQTKTRLKKLSSAKFFKARGKKAFLQGPAVGSIQRIVLARHCPLPT
jgi:hypothetical protein